MLQLASAVANSIDVHVAIAIAAIAITWLMLCL
jgi:hypothetical protein